MHRSTTKSEAEPHPKRDVNIYDDIVFWISLADAVADDQDFPPPAEAPDEVIDLVWKRCHTWAAGNYAFAKRELLSNAENNWPSFAGREDGKLRVYRLCLAVRSALEEIARQFEFVQSHEQDPEEEERDFAVELPLPPTCPVIFLGNIYSGQERRRRRRLGLSVSEENIIDFGVYGAFHDALRKAELFRIRHCGHCHRLFYATRRDKFECSLRCQNAVRQQRRRDKAKAHEAKRQRNKKLGIKPKELITLSAAARQGTVSAKNQREPHFLK
jgi:glutaredoxin